ncbi:MAG: hypothetical protein JW725_01100 [Candidatus Babeliaceae bacterium]|nr:hypothetical protein [Candidatus Babeliaceae bacterium]
MVRRCPHKTNVAEDVNSKTAAALNGVGAMKILAPNVAIPAETNAKDVIVAEKKKAT